MKSYFSLLYFYGKKIKERFLLWHIHTNEQKLTCYLGEKNKKTKQKKKNKKNISEVDPSNNNFWRDHDILFAIMMVL